MLGNKTSRKCVLDQLKNLSEIIFHFNIMYFTLNLFNGIIMEIMAFMEMMDIDVGKCEIMSPCLDVLYQNL